jgi:uncharacterized membrane protein YfcA
MTYVPETRIRRGLPRLRSWYVKLAYIVVAIAIYYLGGGLAPTDNSRGILRSVIVFLLVLLAARVFRGATEFGNQPRPWWRMSGAPMAGFVLGTILGLATIGLGLYGIGLSTESVVREFRSQGPYVAVSAVLFAILAVLYLTSSVRLRGFDREARLEAQRTGDGGSGTSADRLPRG